MKRTLNRVIASAMSASLAIAAVSVATVGCEVKPISELTAEDGVVRLRALHKDENWERLIQEVNEYKSRYPYSQYASEADLLQADAYFRTNRNTLPSRLTRPVGRESQTRTSSSDRG